MQIRDHVQEVAETLEEILEAASKGLSKLPPRKKYGLHSYMNKAQQMRKQKEEEENKYMEKRNKQYEQHRKVLHERLDKMKEEKKKAEQENKQRTESKKKKIKERKQKAKAETEADRDRRVHELEAKRKKEAEDKRKKEEMTHKIQQELEKRKKENRKEFLNKRKSQMHKEFKNISKTRQGNLTEEEQLLRDKELKKKKEEKLKQYFDKQKEMKAQNESAKKEYLNFYDSEPLQKVFENNFEAISESYLKFAKELKYTKKTQPGDFQMSFGAFKKFGHDMKIYPNIISFDDFSHVFKMICKEKTDKVKTIRLEEDSKLNDKDTLIITFNEFKDALARIACLAKFRLGGLQGISEKECKDKDRELKNYLRTRWHKGASSSLQRKVTKNRAGESARNLAVNTKAGKKSEKDVNKTAIINDPMSSLSRNNKGLNSSLTKKDSVSKRTNEPLSGRYNFEKPKKLSKEEQEKLEHDRTLNAAKSFSLKSIKATLDRDKPGHRGSSIPPIIYEDTEFHVFPEIDAEFMTASTLEALVQYLKDIIAAEKAGENLNIVKIKKAPNADKGATQGAGLSPDPQVPNTTANLGAGAKPGNPQQTGSVPLK